MEPAPGVARPADLPPPDLPPAGLPPAGLPPAGLPPNDRSRPLRVVLAVVGTISLAVGVLGIIVPVLPTTPFLLLAAACYARASSRLYAWLLGQRSLGPIITRWRESGSMEPAVKRRAIAIVIVTFAASILLVDALLVRAVLAVTGTIVTVFLVRVPTTA